MNLSMSPSFFVIISTGLFFAAIISLKFGYLGSTPLAVTEITHFSGRLIFSDPSIVCLVKVTLSSISIFLTYEIHGTFKILET